MLSEPAVHYVSECEPCGPGSSIWDAGDRFTAFRLIYRSANTGFYFRVRSDFAVENGMSKYIFRWEPRYRLRKMQKPKQKWS
jgi:hypothetical protein